MAAAHNQSMVQNRVERGVAAGGQFDHHQREESAVTLDRLPELTRLEVVTLKAISDSDESAAARPGDSAWIRGDSGQDLNIAVVEHLIERGLIEIDDGEYWREIRLVDGVAEAVAGIELEPLPSTGLTPAQETALGTIASDGTVCIFGKDMRSGEKTPDLFTQMLDGNGRFGVERSLGTTQVSVRAAKSLWKARLIDVSSSGALSITDSARELLELRPDISIAGSAEVVALQEHRIDNSSYRRGNSVIAGWGGNYRGARATCTCGWTVKSNDGKADLVDGIERHLRAEIDKLIFTWDRQD